MTSNPITGPMPREKLQEAIDAPFGGARKIIQKYDPLWGHAEGELIEWDVTVRRAWRDRGHATVKAASQEEADKLADDLDEFDIDWDNDGEFEIESVEPAK